MKKKSIVNKTELWDFRLSWTTSFLLIGTLANATLKTVLPIPAALWGVISIITGIVMLGSIFICFKEMLRRSSVIFWRSIALFVCIYLLSAVLITSRGEPLDIFLSGNVFYTFVWWIPIGVYSISVYDKSILYNVWVKSSYIISIMCLVMVLFHTPVKDDGTTYYNMSFGFSMILPILIHINEYRRQRYFWLFCLIVFELVLLLIFANRGIFLSLIFYFVYKFAFESNSRIRKIVSILVLILAAIIFTASIQAIAESLLSVLDLFGFQSSRTIEMLASGVITETSGRDELWKISFKMIEESPILGWGLGGEYYHTAKILYGSDVISPDVNCSAHNGIIQNFVNFGIIGGLFATMIVLYPLFHLKQIRDKYAYELVLIFAAVRIIPNCVSGDGFFMVLQCSVYLYLFYFRNRKIPNFQYNMKC